MLAIILAAITTMAPCPGPTTVLINQCLEERYREADGVLARYYQRALRRLRKEDDAETVRWFVEAQRAWLRFRDAECTAVSTSFKGGTIAPSFSSDCMLRVTGMRTYTLWRDWLTYPDSTPPLLPRPDVEQVFSDRRR